MQIITFGVKTTQGSIEEENTNIRGKLKGAWFKIASTTAKAGDIGVAFRVLDANNNKVFFETDFIPNYTERTFVGFPPLEGNFKVTARVMALGSNWTVTIGVIYE